MDDGRDDLLTTVRSASLGDQERRHDSIATDFGRNPHINGEVEPMLIDEAVETRSYVIESGLDHHLPEHYRLLTLLGSGGMAEVFLAEDTRLGRKVAIKFLKNSLRSDPEHLQRFDLEARAASALNHPNIITIYDIGEANGVKYIVSEYIDGESLRTRLQRGRRSIRESVEIAIQIASALAAAHEAGIIHRDLKPDNIMLRKDGSVKVVDFGVAKAAGSIAVAGGFEASTLSPDLTSPGMILGTPAYMSPEQTRGTVLDGRSDIFSLGIILFEMLTGHSPFYAPNPADSIAAILSKDQPRVEDYVSGVPGALADVVGLSLEKDRDDRYASMAEVSSRLNALRNDVVHSSRLSSETIQTDLVKPKLRVSGPGLNRYSALVGAIVLIAILLAGGLWIVRNLGRNQGLNSGNLRSSLITSWNSISAEDVTASTFSPDSRMIAFGSKRSGNDEIWMKPIDGGGDAVQVTKNSFYNKYPIWSPSGQEVAFFSARSENRGIWRVPFTGGQESQIVGGLAAAARPLRWVAGNKLFYRDGYELFVVDVGTGERVQLTNFADQGLRPLEMAVSADGRSAAISIQENGSWKIKIKKLDGPQLDEMAIGPGIIGTIAFQPNTSGEILYDDIVDGNDQILLGGVGRQSTQISPGGSSFHLQDVSADGTKVLYSSVVETSDLWLANLQDGSQTPVANDVTEEYWPAISPDGKGIAYQSATQPDNAYFGSILVRQLGAAGSGVTVASRGFYPTWSHNGQWIAFCRATDAGVGLWKVKPDGSEASELVKQNVQTSGFVSTPSLKLVASHIGWLDDDRLIAYPARINGVSNVWLVGSDGSNPNALTQNNDATTVYSAVYASGDGRSIAFTRSKPGVIYSLWWMRVGETEPKMVYQSTDLFRFLGITDDSHEAIIARQQDPADRSPTPKFTDIYGIALDKGSARKLNSIGGAYFYSISLSNTGNALAYASRTNNMPELWTIAPLNATPRKIIQDMDPKQMFSSLAWSPDGRAIVFGKQTRTNFLSLLN